MSTPNPARDPRPHADRPLSRRESALLFSAFFALALSIASFLTI